MARDRGSASRATTTMLTIAGVRSRIALAVIALLLAPCASMAQDSSKGESGLGKILNLDPPPTKPAPRSNLQDPSAAPARSQALPRSERLPIGPAGAAAETRIEASTPKPATSKFTGPVLALAAVLGVVLLLAGIVRWVGRGRANASLRAELGSGGRSPAGLLEVIGRYPIARGSSLVLLRLDRRILLLSMASGLRGGSSFSTLCEITDPEEVASLLVHARDAEGDSMAERFRTLLARSDDRLQAPQRPELAPSPRQARPAPRVSAIEAKPTDVASAALLERLAARRAAATPAPQPLRRGAAPRLKDISA